MGKEEQIEEREVLDSIFPDEITSCNKGEATAVIPVQLEDHAFLNSIHGRQYQTHRGWFMFSSSNDFADISDSEYRISITLDVINDDGDDSGPPSLFLHVRYPDDYPDEPPILDIFPAHNAPAYSYFDVSSDKDQLISGLKDTIEENMGMAMIFTLVSTLKDSAEQIVTERQAAAREKHEERILAAEREENKKFHGTPVTPETFAKWRLDFRKEMEEVRDREEEAEEAAEKKRNRGKESIERLTGKQLWEKGLAGKVEEEYDDGDDDGLLVGGVEKLKITS